MSRQTTPVPAIVFDALASGDIDQLQFTILCLLRRWSDYKTGRVDSFRAERACKYLRVETTAANIKAMQRTVRALRDAGWFTWDYQRGSKRPYHIWLQDNLVNILRTGRVVDTVVDFVADGVADDATSTPVITDSYGNPSEQAGGYSVADGVADNRDLLSSKHQEAKANAQGGPRFDSKTQALRFRSFVFANTGFHRTHEWAIDLVKQFPVEELEYALVDFMWNPLRDEDGDGKMSRRETGFFLKDGLPMVIDSRRRRHKTGDSPCLEIPFGWKHAEGKTEPEPALKDTKAAELTAV